MRDYFDTTEKESDVIDGWKYVDDGSGDWECEGKVADFMKKKVLDGKRQKILEANDALQKQVRDARLATEEKIASGAVKTGYGEDDVPDVADMNVMDRLESDGVQEAAGAKVEKKPLLGNVRNGALGNGVEIERAETNGYQRPFGGYVSKYLVQFMDGEAERFTSVRKVMREFGFRDVEMIEEKQVNDFLFDYTNWFLRRSRFMLGTLATVGEYSKFKGVEYKTVMAKVFRQISKKSNVRKEHNINLMKYGKNPNDERKNELIVVEICGVKFIMIKPEEMDHWQQYLAKKGIEDRKAVGDHEGIKFLLKVYHNFGGKENLLMDSVYQWVSFSLEAWPGMPQDLDKYRASYRQRLDYRDAYGYYCDVIKENPVKYRIFCKRISHMGFKTYAMNGKRGFYFFYKDIPGITGGTSGYSLSIAAFTSEWEEKYGGGSNYFDIKKTTVEKKKKEEVKLQSVLEYERINSELR